MISQSFDCKSWGAAAAEQRESLFWLNPSVPYFSEDIFLQDLNEVMLAVSPALHAAPGASKEIFPHCKPTPHDFLENSGPSPDYDSYMY